ncbi:related to Dihydroorotate dehydrogenase (quinone), mitochondrial [Armillaria ostoyae]|uniref:Dihydroorotate dehydrogenase (quinone), mitochondrial n=1 Tax=Armillaria ostoyae TaxID=47428 RepID=A0A284RCL0_ARMOS|nr:related to Dihydroorotate dehydrogenase (quinone), mitochondrial [Armillaria ostoyae]
MAALRRAASRSLSSPARIYTAVPSRTLFTRSSPIPQSPVRTGLYATVFAISTGLFAVYYFDSRSAIHRYVLTPLLRYSLDPETGHKFAVQVLRSGLGPKDVVADDERLKFELWGKSISNPVGLAAGFDKDGEAIDGLFDLGFSWVEVGSVTPSPQPGNPRPRFFHLPEDSAVINRYGFPSQGHMSVLNRIRARIPTFLQEDNDTASFRSGSVLAVNLGKNKASPADSIQDFVDGVRMFGPYSDVLVVNVSSPNTPGLRGLQGRDTLQTLLEGVTTARDDLPPSAVTSAPKPKLVLKIAPDLTESQLVEMAEVIRNSRIDGVIVSNTTISRPSSLHHPSKVEAGGLSGTPLKELSLSALRTLRQNLPESIPLIGCGGISSGEDALDYAKAGASLVQVYTGFGYDGAGACRRIKDQIIETLAKDGVTWADVVSKAVKDLSWKEKEKESEVSLLTKEAEELKRLLDALGDKMASGEVGV